MTEPANAERGVQVAPEHYDFERYDDKERWMSYWHQIRAVLEVKPRTVLEIGPGSGVFSGYLRSKGIDVKTLDIDATRGADYVADLTRLDETLPAGVSFDAICAFQVLEHLPLDVFDACLAGIAKRCTGAAFISLPYRGLRVRWAFWWGDHFFTLGHKFMLPWRHKPIPEHYWELGYPITAKKITKRIETHFDVIGRGFIPENPYHYMWRLRKITK
ncbi:MAG TPA: methyltransferase domain-containing protein [Kofleriaceae bacterium]|jgi:2-polyprenyl-3-methyl-5-hydroxy-6-metoxy-1,4-benzoquinol methylase